MKITPFKPTFEKIVRPLTKMQSQLTALATSETTAAEMKDAQAAELVNQSITHRKEADKATKFGAALGTLFGGPGAV